MSKPNEPTRVEWRDGGLFVRLDVETERIAISAAVKKSSSVGAAPPITPVVVNIGTQEADTLADMLRNAIEWLDARQKQVR